jgi:hypothetical protein
MITTEEIKPGQTSREQESDNNTYPIAIRGV